MTLAVPEFSVQDSDAGAAAEAEHPILRDARDHANSKNLRHAGGVAPADAWVLVAGGFAKLIDVRTAEERKFVGHVPGSVHVPWATGTALTRNPRFARELEAKLPKHEIGLLLCRSGNRSTLAAEAAAKAGFTAVFNVLEGFEGDLDAEQRRGRHNGWRHRGLPWVQD